jgi:hypothetical protein
MGRMIFHLTDEDRDALERVRVKLGARSHAESLRRLILAADEAPVVSMSISEGPAPLIAEMRALAALPPGTKVKVVDDGAAPFVPLLKRRDFNPQPKKGAKK